MSGRAAMDGNGDGDGEGDLRWFALFCPAGRERRAALGLRELKFEHYLPCETLWTRHARQRSRTQAPLFPGYLFVRTARESLHWVRGVDGVSGVVGALGRAFAVDAAAVAALQAAEAAGAFDRTGRSGAGKEAAGFAPGQAVRVTGGPFAGFLAEIVSAPSGARRARVLLKALGGGAGGEAAGGEKNWGKAMIDVAKLKVA